MSQIAIYLEEDLQEKLDELAKAEGKSRSAWVKEAILQKMSSGLPESWFQLWGQWEDNRSVKAILQDIDAGYADQKRESLR